VFRGNLYRIATVKHRGGCVMIWGYMNANGVREITDTEGIINICKNDKMSEVF